MQGDMPVDLDDLLDPVRLAALWSARPDAAAPGPVTAAVLPAAPALPAMPVLPAAPVLSLVPPVDHDAHAAGTPADAPADAAAVGPAVGIDVHAHLRELVRAIEHELGAHFEPSSPPRRALDVHVELLRAQILAAWPADAVPTPEARAAALAGALPLLDQLEDLLEALLRGGPWSAPATGGTR
jgi:hypothetical protein